MYNVPVSFSRWRHGEADRNRAAGIRGMPAVFLLDQAKVFEYLSHAWIRQVVEAWRVPGWAGNFFVRMAEGRRLKGNPIPNPPRAIRRGVGMGGCGEHVPAGSLLRPGVMDCDASG